MASIINLPFECFSTATLAQLATLNRSAHELSRKVLLFRDIGHAMYKLCLGLDGADQRTKVHRLSDSDLWRIVASVFDVVGSREKWNTFVVPINQGIRVNSQFVYIKPNYMVQSFTTIDFSNVSPYILNGVDIISYTLTEAIDKIRAKINAPPSNSDDVDNNSDDVDWFTNPINLRLVNFTSHQVYVTEPVIIYKFGDKPQLDCIVDPFGIAEVVLTLLNAKLHI
jgi:hypothetical protein